MHPLICKVGPFAIYSYGVMLAFAFLVSSYLAKKKAQTVGISPEIIFNLAFIAFIFGIIGGRLLYVIFNFDYYIDNLSEIFKLWHGGLSWFGGLFLGSVAGIVYINRKGLCVYKVLDVIVPFVALGQAIGRIGCFLNGCCYGVLGFIPIQIFSSLLLLIIFIILGFLQERPHKAGEIFFLYLILYSIKRFFVEFWRADNKILMFGLTYFQIIAIAIFFFSVWKLLSLKRSCR